MPHNASLTVDVSVIGVEAPAPAREEDLSHFISKDSSHLRECDELLALMPALFDLCKTNDACQLGTHFTCFTGTKVQILTQKARCCSPRARATRAWAFFFFGECVSTGFPQLSWVLTVLGVLV